MKNVIIFLVVSLCAISCRNYEVTPCDKLPSGPHEWLIDALDTLNANLPCFNPNDPNEVLFSRDNKVYIFDMQANSKRLLYSGVQFARPQWGNQGWILLNLSDFNIWKIKENGDSLTQLTTSGGLSPVWNYDYSKIAYERSFGGTSKSILIDDTGLVLDTLNFPVSERFCWNHPIYGSSGRNVVDLEQDTFQFLVEEVNDKEPGSMGSTFLRDGRTVVSSYTTGIYSLDIQTKEFDRVRKSCRAVLYLFPTYSPQLHKIIWAKRSETLVNENTIHVTSRLVMMNPDGTDEEEIDIPK